MLATDRVGQGIEGAAGSPPAVSAVAQADIVVTDLHKSFGVTRALDGCTFSARRGEIHAIVGGNGCGKSTLAKVLSGVLPADSGHVSILGHTPTTPRDARLAGIATVFQEVLVADRCSVLDNLFVGVDGLWSRTRSLGEKRETAWRVMKDLTGIDIDPDAPVEALPLSIKQWLTIGRAFLQEPKVLILDESSAALDLDSTEKLFEKMRDMRDRGVAVLIVTHRIAELIRISDRATVMRDGRDVGVLERGEVTEQNLLRLMTGRSPTAETGDAAIVPQGRSDVVLRARGLKVWPGGGDIAFDLHRGEIVGVAGLDGQGQDEFVRVLAGVQPAAEGVALASRDGGHRFEALRDIADAGRCRVVYVSGDRKREGIFANLSIFENMLIPLYPKTLTSWIGHIVDWASLSSVFDTWIERLSIRFGLRSDKITSLSGGNQQKVLIGRALAQRPHILVLNDPARGIDVETKRELYERLREFAALGNSVVFMSSELEEFAEMCSRVVVFRHGSIFDAFVGDDLDPARILEGMFGQTSGRGARLAASVPAAPEQVAVPAPIRAGGGKAVLPERHDIRIVDFGKHAEHAMSRPPRSGSVPKRTGIAYFDG